MLVYIFYQTMQIYKIYTKKHLKTRCLNFVQLKSVLQHTINTVRQDVPMSAVSHPPRALPLLHLSYKREV